MIIETKEQLKDAINKKEPYFEVVGELAKQLKSTQKIVALSAAGIAALTAAIAVALASIPVAGPVGPAALYAVAAPIAIKTGLDTTTIIAILGFGFGGIGLILALFKGYDVEWTLGPDGLKAKFTRK